MNDLAEKALHGFEAAGRALVARPMRSFAGLGFAIAAVAVVAGGRVNAQQPTRPVSGWFGLQHSHGVPKHPWVAGAVMLGAVLALALLWLGVVRFVRRHEQPERRIWWVAGAWALPFVVGPPLLGTTVQTYVAFGLLQRHGLDPYAFGPARLGSNPIVAAIDPSVRDTPSSAGPLGTLVQHLAVTVSSGSALGALIALRGIAVLCAIVIGRLTAELAGPARARALSLTILNPLVLLYVVSAARLDGLMLVFVLAALSAAGQRRWLLAMALACVAGSVSGQAFLLVPAIVAVHLLGRRTIPVWLLIGRDLLVAAITTIAAGFVVDDGFGWLTTVSKQFSAHPPYSIASGVAELLTPIVRGASYDDLAAGARITVVTAMVCVLVYLVATARHRTLDRTAGYALLALALLSPVTYPWYLLWGVVCLVPAATGVRRVAVLALSVVGCLLNPPGFSATIANVLSGAALVVTAAVLLALPSVRRVTLGAPVATSSR